MYYSKILLQCTVILFLLSFTNEVKSADPSSVSDEIISFRSLKYGMFIHYSLSTFDGLEQTPGSTTSASVYNPTDLDVDQWIQVAKNAGMKYAVLTAKHSSGFCLWDSKVQWKGSEFNYDVAGSGHDATDVVAEFIAACNKYGIVPGIYYCTMDTRHSDPNIVWNPSLPYISEEYFQLMKDHLTELHTRYPEIAIQWIDIPRHLTNNERQTLYDLVRSINPSCLIMFNYGKEAGGISNYTINTAENVTWPTDILNSEVEPIASPFDVQQSYNGITYELVYEHCISITSNWFWKTDETLKSASDLINKRQQVWNLNGNFLLNVPPNREGKIPSATAQRLYDIEPSGGDVDADGVSVSPTLITISIGATTQLTATVSPSNATTKTVSWSSNNTSVATVSSTGLVTGMADGSASITVTTQDGGYTATCNVSVSVIPTQTFELTTSVVGQGSVSPSSGTFIENEQVTLTATPDAGWQFDSWSGDLSGSANPINLTIDSDKSITAVFIESVDPIAGYSYCSDEGQTCTFSGTVDVAYGADGLYNFVYGISDGNVLCDNSTFGDPITGVVKACYVKQVGTTITYSLSTSTNGQGSVSPSTGDFNEGSVISLSATADAGWQFDSWSGDVSSSSNPVSITMDGNKSIIANFSETTNSTTLTIQENETGFCSVAGSIDNNNDGFTGDGFANTDNASGEGITWSVNIPATGNYTLIWRYANGGTTDRTAQLMVDGSTVVSSVSMPSTGSWTSWTETSAVNVNLSAGTKLIRLQATNSSGLSNIDYVTISGGSISAVACAGLKRAAMTTEIADKDINFYPVPIENLLNIQFNRELTETVDVCLYDMTGKMVRSTKAVGSTHSLDMSDLPNGLYAVRIFGENLNVTERVVKQ